VRGGTEETYEISRFSLGLHTEPGFNRADRYTLDKCLNLDIDEEGQLVTRKGCRRVVSSWGASYINQLAVLDVATVPTILMSRGDTAAGPFYLQAATYTGGGASAVITGVYSRYEDAGDTPVSSHGWRFVRFRNRIYATSAAPQSLATGNSTADKFHSGCFRWTWNHGLDTSLDMPLEDASPDGVDDLMAQNAALHHPRAQAVGSPPPKLRRVSHRTFWGTTLGRLIRLRVGAHWWPLLFLWRPRTRVYETVPTQPVLYSGSPAYAYSMPKGRYFYFISYVRSATLGESAPYAVDVYVPEDGMAVRLWNIPAHPDPTVDVVRIYRSTSATEPIMRLLKELPAPPTGTLSYHDPGEDVSITGEPYRGLAAMPTSSTLCIHQGRLWCVTPDNVVMASEPGMPETFVPSEGLVIGPQTGDSVVVLASAGVRAEEEPYSAPIMVLTRTAVYVVVGEAPNITIRPRSETVGCANANTVATYENRVYWLSTDAVYGSDGANVVRISAEAPGWSVGNIEGRLRGMASPRTACAAVANARYYLSCTDNKGDARVFVFDIRRGVWTERSYPFTITALTTFKARNAKEFLFAASSDGNVFELDVGDTDQDDHGNVVAISWNTKLNANWFGNKGQRKRYRRFRVITPYNRDMTIRTYVGATVAHQSKTLEAADLPSWGDFAWNDGTLWQDRALRRIEEGFDDGTVGYNLATELAGSGRHVLTSVAIDMRRLR